MAYFDVALLSEDQDWLKRITACAATEGIPDSQTWATVHRWEVSSAPGFGDKYASALAGDVEHPGRDQSVISDLELLSSVQATAASSTSNTSWGSAATTTATPA